MITEQICVLRKQRTQWAQELLCSQDWVILDTETTGIGSEAEIVQIGLLAPSGEVLMDALVKPLCPIPAEATQIHGITDEIVARAPDLEDLLIDIERIINHKRILVYNAQYDFGIIHSCLTRRWCKESVPALRPSDPDPHEWVANWMSASEWVDVMVPYSEWVGERSAKHEGFRWQKLPGGDHSAIGDCKATLEILWRMAGPEFEQAYRKGETDGK